MKWQRLCLVLLPAWAMMYGLIALLSLQAADRAYHQANWNGLEYWADKIRKYHNQGGSLGAELSLEELYHFLLQKGERRLLPSHMLDPYGQAYILQVNVADRLVTVLSKGADGLQATDDDLIFELALP